MLHGYYITLIIIPHPGGARGVMVIVVGNGHGDMSSKSWTRLIVFRMALIAMGKV